MTGPVCKCLVVGSGSIARRHIRNLRALLPGAAVACISASGRTLSAGETDATDLPASMAAALDWGADLAIVASPAPLHLDHASALLEAGVPVMIEKPLADSLDRWALHEALLNRHRDRIEVAYNLRYLSSAQRMKSLVADKAAGRIHSIDIDVGQHLPDWRPQSDYRANVSARRELGGGVLLELSHEFDYLSWLFGRFETIYCLMSNSGQLEIDVEDRVDMLLSRADGTVARLHLDFLQQKATRRCKVIGSEATLVWDLNANSIVRQTASGDETLFSETAVDRNTMYLEQLRGFVSIAAGEARPRIGIEDGYTVLALIDAMRRSAASGHPISLTAG